MATSSEMVKRIENILGKFFKALNDHNIGIIPNNTIDKVALYKYLLMLTHQQIINLYPQIKMGPKIMLEYFIDQLKMEYILIHKQHPGLLPDFGVIVTTRSGLFSDNLTDCLENISLGQNNSD